MRDLSRLLKALCCFVVLCLSAGISTAGAAHAKRPAPAGEAGAKASAPARPAAVVRVEQVSGKDYSRIVITLSRQTQHHYQLLPADPKSGNIRRIYVDLDDSRIASGVPGLLNVAGGLMRKVRVAPYKPGVSRVVVDVENLRTYKVFTLENPYRVVVDVQGEMKLAPPPPPDPVQEEACAQAEKAKAANPRYKLPAACKRMAKRLVEQLGLTVRTVMIDPGHGGKDPGARSKSGLEEKQVTLRLATLVGAKLERAGLTVLYTRTSDKFVPLEYRTALANAKKADLFLSIHCNAHREPTSTGLETYSLNLATTPEEVRVAARENSVDSKRISDMRDLLADLMLTSRLTESREFAKSTHQAALSQARKVMHLRDRGLHEAPFYVLMGANMPAVLIESGYITNPAEAAKLDDPAYLDKLAQGITEGVLAYKAKLERAGSNS